MAKKEMTELIAKNGVTIYICSECGTHFARKPFQEEVHNVICPTCFPCAFHELCDYRFCDSGMRCKR